jgi:hypothetical protein
MELPQVNTSEITNQLAEHKNELVRNPYKFIYMRKNNS